MSNLIKKLLEPTLGLEEQVKILKNLNEIFLKPQDLKNLIVSLQKKMSSNLKMPGAMDVCGTGGSGLERINTSTISAFILSGLEVPIAKHGNKAASSRFGSFDLLEKMEIKIELEPQELEFLFKMEKLAFIYARTFHPTMKNFVEGRKKVGVPTIFNLIGPFLNPANPSIQLIGTAFKDKMELLIETAKLLEKKKIMIVRGEDGLDEVSLTGETSVYELNQGVIKKYKITPEEFGIKRCIFEDIKGGDEKFNSNIASDILNGSCKTRHLDLVLINVSLALKLYGKVKNLRLGYDMAKNYIKGKEMGFRKFYNYKKKSNLGILLEIASNKKKEVEIRMNKYSLEKNNLINYDSEKNNLFKKVLEKSGISLIGEIKMASPSKGQIYKGRLTIEEIAKIYIEEKVDAISVLGDEKYFGGSLENLKIVRSVLDKYCDLSPNKIPVLLKDFIIDESQIYEAQKYGADAILLIYDLLGGEKIKQFLKLTKKIGMSALVEIHDNFEEQEFDNYLLEAEIVGINNRNLKTFKVNIEKTNKLIKKIPENRLVVSESGIKGKDDMKKLNRRVNAILVGTGLLGKGDLRENIQKYKYI